MLAARWRKAFRRIVVILSVSALTLGITCTARYALAPAPLGDVLGVTLALWPHGTPPLDEIWGGSGPSNLDLALTQFCAFWGPVIVRVWLALPGGGAAFVSGT